MSQSGALDLRLPIGGLFTILGLLVGGYGLATNGDAVLYERSVGVNINLWWGLVMLVVGVLLLVLGLRATREAHPASALPASETPGGRATERREREKGLEH